MSQIEQAAYEDGWEEYEGVLTRLKFRSTGVLRFGKGFLVDLLGWNLSTRFITEFRRVNF